MKTVLITGGTRGIGRECAECFAEQGYKVIIIYKSSRDAAEELARRSGCEYYCCDVRDHRAVHDLAAVVHPDVLINNAGIAANALITDVDEELWDDIFDTNVKGAYNCIHAFLPCMIRRQYGRIINISSMWGQVGASCEVPYSASKAAVIGLTKALAKECAPSGITVNCIAPGLIDTDMNAGLTADAKAALVEETPVNRIGTTYDIARTALFLADETADFITGQVIGVNGGLVI